MKKHINRLGVRTASAVAAMVLVATAAWALEPFKVQDIRVEGLQRGARHHLRIHATARGR